MKILPFILIIFGIILLFTSLLADLIGIGDFPGFGYKQVIGTVIGIGIIITGLVLNRIEHIGRFKDRITLLFQQTLKAEFNNDFFIALIILSISLVIRLFYYYSHLDLSNFLSIVGVPFCDARHWNEVAISISQGRGFVNPNRPFYPILLAIFYTWFGPPSF